MKQIPKYVDALLKKRTKAARELRNAICNVDSYCEKIGLDYNHPLFSDACLCSDIRIFCEEGASEDTTRKAILKVLNEDRKEKAELENK